MKSSTRTVMVLLAHSVGAAAAVAQAPTSAQVWDVRFVADSVGAFAQGPGATQVGITIYARVGILPNTAPDGTNNFGVSRVGGPGSATSGFRLTFSDVISAGQGLGQGRVDRGLTSDLDGRSLVDNLGRPLTGHMPPFRAGMSSSGPEPHFGSNTDSFNGQLFNPSTGSPTLSNVSTSRQIFFGSEGSGPLGVATAVDANPANLIGDLTPVYRMYYFPRQDVTRTISVTVVGLSARYLSEVSGGTSGLAQSGPTCNLPNQVFSFQVPGPGAGAAMLLGALGAARRRRGT